MEEARIYHLEASLSLLNLSVCACCVAMSQPGSQYGLFVSVGKSFEWRWRHLIIYAEGRKEKTRGPGSLIENGEQSPNLRRCICRGVLLCPANFI